MNTAKDITLGSDLSNKKHVIELNFRVRISFHI